MEHIGINADTPGIRLLGRMDPEQAFPALDWTGSGMECRFRGSNIWAELEAPEAKPVFWMAVLLDGRMIARFPVEGGCRFYPLALGMEADKERVVTLLKETQCMPSDPGATVFLRSLRHDGELLPLPEKKLKIEFVGDSLTSGEGALAPEGNEEWITPWFTAAAGYVHAACRELEAEYRILSQSGYGVGWSWEHREEHNLFDGYELTVGVLEGEKAEKRGCRKPHDFTSWQPDIVCVRLTTNDVNGMRMKESIGTERETLIIRVTEMIRKVRRCNPGAKIVWILPGTDSCPEIAAEGVRRVKAEGMERVEAFALPDYGPGDFGARFHPSAEWNQKAGRILAEYLKTIR